MDQRDNSLEQTDALLDTALRSYAAPGENTGLEARLLVRTAEARNKKRLIGLPRVWAVGAGLAAAAALLIAVALTPALHKHSTRRGSVSTKTDDIRVSYPEPPVAQTFLPEPRAVRAATRIRRVHAVQAERAARLVSKPFLIVPPSAEERGLLLLNNEERAELLSNNSPEKPHYFDPASLEVSVIQITPLDIKAIEDK